MVLVHSSLINVVDIKEKIFNYGVIVISSVLINMMTSWHCSYKSQLLSFTNKTVLSNDETNKTHTYNVLWLESLKMHENNTKTKHPITNIPELQMISLSLSLFWSFCLFVCLQHSFWNLTNRKREISGFVFLFFKQYDSGRLGLLCMTCSILSRS